MYPPGHDRQTAGEEVGLFSGRDVLAAKVRKEGTHVLYSKPDLIHTNSLGCAPVSVPPQQGVLDKHGHTQAVLDILVENAGHVNVGAPFESRKGIICTL